MRLKWCFAVAVLSVIGFSSILCDDPCTSSTELHSIEGRSPTSSGNIQCDAYISEGWYKMARYDMVTFNPGNSKCGSVFPIYLKENFTDKSDIQNLTACMVGIGDSCAETIPVRVKKCDVDTAYYLKPTKSCDSTYCFSKSREFSDPAPTWIPKTVSVITETNFINTTPVYFFKCDFDMPSEKLLYKIYWYVNSKKIKDSGFIEKDCIQTEGYLLENDLLSSGFKLNIMVSCGVVAAKTIKGEPGSFKKSDDFFAGIKVVTKTVNIESGKSAKAVLLPTIPIPCPSFLNSCNYQIWMYQRTQGDYECSKNVKLGTGNRCGTTIEGKNKSDTLWFNNQKWHKNITFDIIHRKDLNSYRDKNIHYTLRLRVSDTLYNKLLANTLIEDITVTIYDKTSGLLEKKVCSGEVDPHMSTLDGNKFEMQLQGEFLMYRNKKYKTMVQVKTTTCYSHRSDIYCICGIVIRSGRDIFMIYMCPDTPTKIDQFIRCHDGSLTANSRGGSDYEIYLPSGTKVQVKIDKSIKSDSFINVYIYPTSLDLHQTEGLCGLFDDNWSNDFILRDRSYAKILQRNVHEKTKWAFKGVDDFSKSWRLSDDERLFPHKGVEEKYDLLTPINNTVQFCYCPYSDEEYHNIVSVKPTGMINKAECDYRQYASCTDKRNIELPCRYHKQRKRRSIMKINRDPDITHGINKRAAVKTYTESEAYDACKKVFDKAEIIQKCSGANLIDNSSLSLCVMDYMITGDERWISSHIDSARSQCMHEVEYNNTLQDDQPDLVSEITNLDCQNNCSNQGLCVNGTCKCNDGYLDTDCSVNIADPPPIHGTSHGELCDKSKEDCQEIDLYGEAFLHEYPPALKIQKYTITFTNEKKLSNSFSKRCIWRGQFEVTCEFYEKRTKRNTKTENAFVTQYTYSISNDGKHYSDEMILHVMDSSCQEIKNNSNGITFYLKDKHCFIDGICYMDDDKDPTSSCNVCSSGTDKYVWTVSNEGDCVSKTSVDNKSGTVSLIIGLTVGGSILAVLMVVVGFLIVKYKKPAAKLENKKNYEREPSSCRDFEIFQANTDVKKWVDATGVQLAE